MTQKKRFTREEYIIITSKVANNPCNLSEAFRQAAIELDRTPKSIHNVWYRTLQKNTYCFATIGRSSSNVNRKIITPVTSDNTKKSSLKFFHNLIKYILKLK